MVGNFNNLIMLRVCETATAELLTKQLPQVEVRSRQVSSGVTDTPGGINSFSSNTREQVVTRNVPLLDTAALIQLPKGQALLYLRVDSCGKFVCHCPWRINPAHYRSPSHNWRPGCRRASRDRRNE